MTKFFDERLTEVIKRPLITEKATKALDLNQYTFEVDPRAAKPDIKAAVEKMFDVKVLGISTMNPPRKSRRVGRFSGKRPQVKKAVVRLAENLPTLLLFLGGFIVLIPRTLTSNIFSTAAFISGLAALGSTSKVY